MVHTKPRLKSVIPQLNIILTHSRYSHISLEPNSENPSLSDQVVFHSLLGGVGAILCCVFLLMQSPP